MSFADFEASDAAIANMNGQYLMNKEISVQYAYKKDGKGERHGDQAERMLAAQARKHNVQPQVQPLPPQIMGSGAALVPGNVVNNEGPRPMGTSGPPDFGGARGAVPTPPQQQRPAPSPQPLAAPPRQAYLRDLPHPRLATEALKGFYLPDLATLVSSQTFLKERHHRDLVLPLVWELP